VRLKWIKKLLFLNYKFIHIEIALLLLLSGILQINDVDKYKDIFTHPDIVLDNIIKNFTLLTISDLTHNVIGLILVIMSFGLFLRSRLSWILTFGVGFFGLILESYFGADIPIYLLVYEFFVLVLLFVFRDVFDRTSFTASTLFALTAVVFTLSFGAVGSYALGNEFHPPIQDLFTGLYYTVVTTTTVGYGDIIPQTVHAKLFSVILIIVGLVIFVAAITNFLSPLINDQLMNIIKTRRKKMNRENHIIIVGDNSLAKNLIKELTSRKISISVVFQKQPLIAESEMPEDYVIGDGSDEAILASIQIDTAATFMALSDDDADNAFMIMAAKELNPKIQTVVAVSDANNITKLKRVHPDVILALPVIAAELMAMALNGEDIKTDYFFKQLAKLKKF